MKKTTKRFFSMLLALAMVLSLAPTTVWAAPHDHSNQTVTGSAAEENPTVDFSTSFEAPMLLSAEGVEVDDEDPAIITLKAELEDIKVLGAEGEPVPLTEAQIAEVLALYQQYLDHWKANMDVLGAQTPFFLAYNDNVDGLGMLGEMLALANVDVNVVRAGYMSYDDLTGMIQNFYFGDALGVQFYGAAVEAARNEVLDQIAASGAKTDVQKYLIINNWLAQNVVFDMEYIMNTDKDTNGDGVIDENDDNVDSMVAENPQKHEHYDNVYNVIYQQYEKQIRDQFEGQIRAGLEAEFKNQFYTGAIEAGYKQGVAAEVESQIKQAYYQQGYDAVYQDAYDQAYAEYMASCTHENGTSVVTAPTCTEEGYTTVTCADCGVTIVTERVPALGHSWDEGVVTTEPTCEANGVKTFTCAACAETYTEDIPALGHKDENGDDICDVCGAAVTGVHEHNYATVVVTEPTCTEQGYTTHTCVCGDSYTDTVVDALGHDFGDWAISKAPTCTETGEMTRECSRCDAAETENVAAEGHKYESVVTDPTCTEAGYTTYTCSVCADSYQADEVAALGHTYEDAVIEPTCTEQGYTTHTCTVCEYFYNDSYTDALGHVDEDADGICERCENEISSDHEHVYASTVTVAATCGDDGLRTYSCLCGDTYTEVIPATGKHVDNYADNVCDICGQDIPYESNFVPGTLNEGEEEKSEFVKAAEAYAADKAHTAADAAGNAVVEENAEAIAEQVEATAASETEKFMTENGEAISADPVAFTEAAFGAEAAAQIAQQWEAFWADAQQNGVEVDPVNAPGYKMTIDEIVAQQMDTAMDDLQGMTPNQAIPVYAEQAALGLTDGVLNYWQGHQFGALGRGLAVCLGYTKAFAYLVQCVESDIYTTDGNIDNAASWKTNEELYYTNGELDISKNYAVDCVRISFDANVTMYGETQENFNSDHFWNAVQVDGKWYYVDPCYTDVYTEVMIRDRVETDGSMNHLYFMFSHDTAANLYDGYYSVIKTLYDGVASHTDYEDSWISRIKSNIYPNNGFFYYVYDSTDMVSLMDEFENSSDMSDIELSNSEMKLVRHKLDTSDAGADGDADYDALIEFNYLENEEDEESVARVKDKDGNMVENEMLTALYAKYEAERELYPSLAITCAFYNNKVYFNLSNAILYYDLNTCEVVVAKEYNIVHAQRDKTNPFGGMAFSVVNSINMADLSVKNHPIAGISLKDDGKLYVSVATNYAFISGKDPHNSADQGSFGYEFEESNFNSAYNSYTNDQMNDSGMAESMGYETEKNDNDEFMWSANFVETLDMKHLDGTSHTYEEVSVNATCGRNAYTENRCTTCGASEDGTRVEIADTAHEHHYIRFEETYYTKASNGNWNTGFCYICTECLFAVEEPTEPDPNQDYGSYGTSYEEQMEIYEKEKAIYDEAVASAGHTYVPTDAVWTEDSTSVSFKNLICDGICVDRENYLDCLINNDASGNTSIEAQLSATVTAEASVAGYTGDCTEGAVAIYVASGETKGHKFTATNELTLEPGNHAYEGTFTWTDVLDEEGNPTGEYAATADVVCGICGEAHEGLTATVVYDAENSTTSTCAVAGKDIYVATVNVTNDNGDVIGTATSTKVVDLELLPHEFDEPTVTEPTCTEQGFSAYTCVACGYIHEDNYTDALGHDWSGIDCNRCGATRENPFTDVPNDSLYIDPILWAVEKNITTGATPTTFNPNGDCLRAQVVTFLWRAAGEPEPTSNNNPFTDVKESDYFYKAVLWAVEEGITTGATLTTFDPNGVCQRAHVVTFLWRAAGEPKPTSNTNPFTDAKESNFFYDAVMWAVEEGITTGATPTAFNPYGNCLRAQIVTFLYRFYED